MAARTLSPCPQVLLVELLTTTMKSKMERRRKHQSSNVVSRVEGLLCPPHAQVEPSRYFPCLPGVYSFLNQHQHSRVDVTQFQEIFTKYSWY